jgi:hypothetical protein
MSIPNSAYYASTTKTWTSLDSYAVNDVVVYNQKLYQCSVTRTATATTPDVDTSHWNFLNNYLPAQAVATDTFKTLREDMDYQLLGTGNVDYRLTKAELDVLNILNNNFGGYSAPRTGLNARLTTDETAITAILGLTGAPYTGSALNTEITSLETKIANVVGQSGAPYTGSALATTITSLQTQITNVVGQSGAPYTGSALATTIASVLSRLTTDEGAINAILALSGSPYTGSALKTEIDGLETKIANVVAQSGAPYTSSALATTLTSLQTQITNVVAQSGAPYAGSAIATTLTSLQSQLTAILSQTGSPYTGSAIATTLTSLQTQITAINAYGYARFKNAWVTSTAYAVGDTVTQGTFSSVYVCATAHTSGTFATDLGAGKWVLFLDLTGAFKKYQIVASSSTPTLAATAGGSYFLDSTGGPMTINLPTTPTIGDPPINFTHIDGDLTDVGNAFSITIAHGSKNIMGFAEDLKLDKNNVSFTLVYSDTTHGWRITIL